MNQSRFEYLLHKIAAAEIQTEPFPHLYIENFFNESDFAAITSAKEIDFAPVETNEALFDKLQSHDYKVIQFPGCTTSKKHYLKWYKDKKKGKHSNNSTCEGMGMTLRLRKPHTPILAEIQEYMQSPAFNEVMAQRFDIDLAQCSVDNGIQKYLDGYEISPHPDIRKKALTFMININPHDDSHLLAHHTHLLKFKPAYSYVPEFWRNNEGIERCWVPWSWCDSTKRHTSNNSIVVFAPSERTMHAVKAHYNHLAAQRTQLYGNLWYKDHTKSVSGLAVQEWQDIDIAAHARPQRLTLKQKIRRILPESYVRALNKARGRNPD